MSSENSIETALGFTHIPKNAGTSIIRFISENKLPIQTSNHWYHKQLGMEEIVVLRCPLDRFQSAFHCGKKYWANPVNRQFSSANELAECASDPGHAKHKLAWVELGNKPGDIFRRNLSNDPVHSVQGRTIDFTFVYEPQSSWMLNNPRHILRFNKLEQDFADLMRKLQFGNNVTLMRLNKSDNNAEQYFSDKSIKFLKDIYRKDFSLINSLGLNL